MQPLDAMAPTVSSPPAALGPRPTWLRPLPWRRLAMFYAAGGLMCAGLWLSAGRFLNHAGAASHANGGASLVVAETDYDLGHVTAETVVRHEFTVQNRGTTRIVLNEETCCGDAHSRIVPPGGQLAIPVVLATGDRAGRVRQTVTVTTSDPARPRIQFTLTARVAERS